MASNMLNLSLSSTLREVTFAGDSVLLSGQVDYPQRPVPKEGFPLLFILHDAQCTTRERYIAHAQVALENGFAVFRWDKRGTGRSGASALGSTTQDAVNAYEIALEQPQVNRRRVIILAQGAGTGILGTSYGLFARLQNPYGVILASNMLENEAVLAIDTRVLIVVGEKDWNPWQQYAELACEAHRKAYSHGAEYHIIPGSDRKLLDLSRPAPIIHRQALIVMAQWLQQLCPTSRLI